MVMPYEVDAQLPAYVKVSDACRGLESPYPAPLDNDTTR
jgi:hypothetical protein